jgi:geranylgeranyl diphosphate synthase type I
MFQQLAARYLPELDTAMREIVALVPNHVPDFGVMLRYPLGWVDEYDQPYAKGTGKRIRPLLLLLCAEASGGDWRRALPAAASVELLHNFSLIHDDIQDDSPTRHGRPTVWKVWGFANAINAGDTMFTLSYAALHTLHAAGLSAELTLRVWDIFNRTNLELTRGQHLDMRFEKQLVVSVDEYLSMITGKSAALIAACAQMGALIGSENEPISAEFAAFGLNLGLAFQIRDDILGIWGDQAATGKSAATDILSRKKSLPVLYGLSHSPELTTLYQRELFGEAEVEEAVAVLNKVGAQDYSVAQETHYYNLALEALDRARLPAESAEPLRELSEWLFGRKT